MARQRMNLTRWMLAILMMAGCLSAAPLGAQDMTSQAPSLKWIPADAAVFNTMLRNREQIELVLNSKAWARLVSLPIIQKNIEEYKKSGGDSAQKKIDELLKDPAKAEIINFYSEVLNDEMFFYCARNTGDFVVLLQEIGLAPLASLIKDGPGAQQRPEDVAHTLLTALDAQGDKLKFPDLVIGFKFSKTKPSDAVKLVDKTAQAAIQLAPPMFKNLYKKLQVNGNDVHAVVLDGQMVPWDQIPFKQIEEQPGQFNKLIARLRALKFTVTVSVRDNYLLLSLGEGTAGLQSLGQGKKLADRDELKPLSLATGKRITSMGYISKDFLTAAGGKFDVDEIMKPIGAMLKEAELPAGQTIRIKKDIRAFLTDLKRMTPEVGAQLGFVFLTDKGTESYAYDWTKNHGYDSSKSLTLLDHLGGNPLAFTVSRTPINIEDYDLMVKWLKVAHDYFEELALPALPPEGRKAYRQVMKQIQPLLARLDKATGKMLLPSLDGQSSLVVDAKLMSKQWHKEMPETAKAMPAPELAIAIGLRDADLFRKAVAEYKDIINGFMEVAGKLAPGGLPPEVKITDPKSQKTKNGTLYFYPVPDELGLDKQLVPTAGLSDRVIVFALSQTHASRLLEKTPLTAKDGLMIDAKKPLASASYIDWAGSVDAATPWVDFVLAEIEKEQGQGPRKVFKSVDRPINPDFKPLPPIDKKDFKDKLPEKQPINPKNFDKDKGPRNQGEFQKVAFQGGKGPGMPDFKVIREQVHTVLQILKVFRGFTSIAYVEDGAVVTHSWAVFKDLEK